MHHATIYAEPKLGIHTNTRAYEYIIIELKSQARYISLAMASTGFSTNFIYRVFPLILDILDPQKPTTKVKPHYLRYV